MKDRKSKICKWEFIQTHGEYEPIEYYQTSCDRTPDSDSEHAYKSLKTGKCYHCEKPIELKED